MDGQTQNNKEIQRQKGGEAVLFPQKGEAEMLCLSVFILHSGRKGTWLPTDRWRCSVGTITTYRKNKPGETVMEKTKKKIK